MKLINANEIFYRDMSDGQVPEGLWYTFKDNIDEMPAIEAIPVEWIKQYMERVGRIGYVEVMLEDWKKENE